MTPRSTHTLSSSREEQSSTPGEVRLETRDDPRIEQPADAIIRLAGTCVCGSDLWPYRRLAMSSPVTVTVAAAATVTARMAGETTNAWP